MLDNFKTLLIDTTKSYKSYLYIALAVVLAFAGYKGWGYYQKYIKSQVTVLQQNILDRDKKIASLTEEYNKLASAKKDVEIENSKLRTDNDILVKKAHDVVVPPIPVVPTEEATVIADLKVDGVEFKPLQGTLFSTDHTSLPTIWTWDKQAARVPFLETKLTDTEQALDSSTLLIGGLSKQIVISDKMLSDADSRESLHKANEIDLNKQIKEKDKQIIIAETNGWIRVGIAIPVTYFLTKAIIKK